MKNLQLLLIACFLFGYGKTKAQDLIYKKDNTVIIAVLVEIGEVDIKYKEYIKQDGGVLTISKSEVVKIKTERGKEILFEQNSTMTYDKKNAIKIGLFSWYLSHLSFSYERSFAPTGNMEVHFGIIGIGYKRDDVAELGGFFTRVGCKLMISHKAKESHLLEGSYLRPEVTLGYFRETLFDPSYGSLIHWKTLPTTNVNFFALMLNIGHQWVIADDYLIDVFCGAGFGGNTGDMREDNYVIAGPNPLFLNAGLKIGMLFK